MRVVVTAANGFVGRALATRLVSDGHHVIGTARRPCDAPHVSVIVGPDVNIDTDWTPAVAGADVIVHLVARTHTLDERGTDKLDVYRSVNVGGTMSLASAAARARVRRIVFVSSIKVNGERTPDGRPFRHDDPPAPEDAYGISKLEAEEVVAQAGRSGLETVIVRPPLVYGTGCRGNFARLRDAVRRGTPLPLGLIHNRRSLVALDNLVDLLARCTTDPAAAGQTFLVSDGEDLSTPQLIRRLSAAMNRSARLLPVPPSLLRVIGTLTGRSAQVRRLLESLQVDISHTCGTLGWQPPLGVDEGLRRAVSND